MKKFICMADMGSVKIVSDSFNVCFSNGFGDGYFTVFVGKKPPVYKVYPNGKDKGWQYKHGHKVNFEGHFTVKEKEKVKIAQYDCKHETFDFTFPIGRWFVENYRGNIYINKVDNDIHA